MKRTATSLAIACAALMPLRSSWAADLLGLYVGGSIAQARLEAAENVPDVVDQPVPGATSYSGSLAEHATAFTAMAGIRPLPFVGAEVSYEDFGRAKGHYSDFFGVGNPGLNQATLSMKGESAFGVLYLPLPHIDLFAKAGMAVINSSLTAYKNYSPPCDGNNFCTLLIEIVPTNVDRTDAGLAAGAGAQLKLGAWAIRGEYEYFNAAGAHPSLLSLGVTWTL